MSRPKEFELGDTVRFKTVFKDDGVAQEPDATNGDHDVQITVENLSTDELMVDEAEMNEVSNTEFNYDWQTTQGMMQGEYSVEATGSFGGDEAVNRDVIRLVNIKR